jgi:hypothetical protein
MFCAARLSEVMLCGFLVTAARTCGCCLLRLLARCLPSAALSGGLGPHYAAAAAHLWLSLLLALCQCACTCQMGMASPANELALCVLCGAVRTCSYGWGSIRTLFSSVLTFSVCSGRTDWAFADMLRSSYVVRRDCSCGAVPAPGSFFGESGCPWLRIIPFWMHTVCIDFASPALTRALFVYAVDNHAWCWPVR